MTGSTALIVSYINGIILMAMVYYAFSRIFAPAVNKNWILLALFTYSIISSSLFHILDSPWVNLAVSSLSFFVILMSLFSGNLSAKFVFALIAYIMTVVADGIAFLSLGYVYYIQYGTEMPLEFIMTVGRTVTSVVFLPLMIINVMLFRKFVKKATDKHFRVPAKYTISVLLILVGVVLIYVLLATSAIAGQIQTNLAQIMITPFILLAIISLIVWQYNQMLVHLETLEENNLKDQMLGQWEIRYNDAVISQKALHDLDYHFVTLLGLLQAGKATEMEKHLTNMIGNFKHTINTKNMPIDIILNYYQQKVKETLDIDLETALLIPANMKLDTALTVMVLGNALENALEACKHVAHPERYIHVEAAMVTHNKLLLTITNPYTAAPIADEEGNLLTTKADKSSHGLGLASAKELLSEELGYVHTEYAEGTFKFMLFLYDVCLEDMTNATKKEHFSTKSLLG